MIAKWLRKACRTGRSVVSRSAMLRSMYSVQLLEDRLLLSSTSGQIFVTDDYRIGEYTATGAAVNSSLVVGLNTPTNLAGSGSDLFVVNEGSTSSNGTIGEYSTSGATINASLISGLVYPSGIAVSGSDLFVTNYGAGTIGEYTTSGVTVNSSLVSLAMNDPEGISVSGSNLFVANYISGTVGEYTTSGETVNTSLITGLNYPMDVAVSGSDVFVTSYNSNTHIGTIGEYTTSGATVNASLVSGSAIFGGIAVSGSHLFVTNGDGVGEYTLAGSPINASLVSGLSGPGLSGTLGIYVEPTVAPATQLAFAQLPTEASITVDIEDATGDIVANDSSDVTLSISSGPSGANLSGASTVPAVNGVATFDDVLFNIAGTYTITAADSADGLQPTTSSPFDVSMTTNPMIGQIFAVGDDEISEYSTSGATVDASLVSGLSDPYGIAVSGSDLFVVNTEVGSAAGWIGEYTTSGTTVNASLVSGLTGPFAIAVSGPDLFVTDQVTGQIGEYTTSGETVNASLVAGMNNARGIAVSGQDLFVTNLVAGTISEYTTAGATVNANLVSGLDGPAGITVAGPDLFVTNLGNGTIGEYTTSGATVNAALVSGLNGPAMGSPDGIVAFGSDLFVTNVGDSPNGPQGGVIIGSGSIGEYSTDGATVRAALVSGSNPVALCVESAQPVGLLATVLLNASENPVASNTAVTFTATIAGSGPAPTGTVTFFDGTTPLGSPVPISGGSAVFQASSLPYNRNSITALYSGDSNYAGTVSQAVNEAVLDVTPALVGVLPASVVAGTVLKLKGKIAFAAGSIPVAGKTSANILLSPDQTVADSVLTLASSSVRLKLKAGKVASFNLKFPKSIPASLGAGIYHILIQFTDTTGAISTIDAGRSLDVVTPVVDLTGSFVKVPASVKAGKKFVATFQITNMSDANVAAAGILPIAIKTSSDSQLADAILLETLKRPINLKPGKSLKIALTLSAGASTDLLVVNVDPAHTAFSDDPEVANEVFFSQQIIVV